MLLLFHSHVFLFMVLVLLSRSYERDAISDSTMSNHEVRYNVLEFDSMQLFSRLIFDF